MLSSCTAPKFVFDDREKIFLILSGLKGISANSNCLLRSVERGRKKERRENYKKNTLLLLYVYITFEMWREREYPVFSSHFPKNNAVHRHVKRVFEIRKWRFDVAI